jgi:hypothetical protein
MLSPRKRADAISSLSSPRLRNILAYLADEAESEKSRDTIDALIQLRRFSDERFPDPEFVEYAERKLGALTPTSREQSGGIQTLERATTSERLSTEPGGIIPEPRDGGQITRENASKTPPNGPGRSQQQMAQNRLPNKKHSRSPSSLQQQSPTKILRQTVFAHDIKRNRKVAVRSLGFQGVWYEDYDYLVAVDAENMLTVYPPRQLDSVTGELWPRKDSFKRTAVPGIYRIRRGGEGCTKIILSSESQEEDDKNTMLLELWSDTEVSEFVALLWELMVKKPRILAEDK